MEGNEDLGSYGCEDADTDSEGEPSIDELALAVVPDWLVERHPNHNWPEIVAWTPVALSALAFVVILFATDTQILDNYIDFGEGRGVAPLTTPSAALTLLGLPIGAVVGWRAGRMRSPGRRAWKALGYSFGGGAYGAMAGFVGALAGLAVWLILVLILGALGVG